MNATLVPGWLRWAASPLNRAGHTVRRGSESGLGVDGSIPGGSWDESQRSVDGLYFPTRERHVRGLNPPVSASGQSWHFQLSQPMGHLRARGTVPGELSCC